MCSTCGNEVEAVVPSWKDHSKETVALLGLETCAENIHVQGSPDFCDAFSGPINCGLHSITGNVVVSVGLHSKAIPGITAVMLML